MGHVVGLEGNLEAERVAGLLIRKVGDESESLTKSGCVGVPSSLSSELLLVLDWFSSSSSLPNELSELLTSLLASLFLLRSIFAIRMFVCSKMDIGVPRFLHDWPWMTDQSIACGIGPVCP